MHPIPTRILFLLLLFSSLVAAANFTQCLEDFRKNDPSTIGGVDSHGRPTSPAQAVGLTYKTCTARCGSDAGSFVWNEFAQSLASRLLPWLALISQLPFGLENYTDDFVSVIMSVGSPALAAYSLVLTSLNIRSVYRRAQQIRHESKFVVARTLVSLQQTPLELTRDERLLIFIPINDHWRREIVDRLNSRKAQSVAINSFVGSVGIAFVFTVMDSFSSINDSNDAAYEGHADGTLWLWLLCVVVGWFWVPTFSCSELKSAIGHANEKAAKKAAKMIRQNATKAYNSAKTKITNRLPIPKGPRKAVVSFVDRIPGENEVKGGPALKRSKKPVVDPVPEVDEENEKVEVESIHKDTKPVGQETEPEANPIPNFTHRQSTVPWQSPAESHHGYGYLNTSANPTANQSAVSLSRSAAAYSIATQSEIFPERDRLLIPKDNLGSLNRDERRLAAMFNYSRIMRYLVLVDDVLGVLDRLTHEKDEGRRPVSEITSARPARDVVFPQGALFSMFIASILALILQCATTAAAVIITIFTPIITLGCRTLGHTLYGGISLLILSLTITSTIFARISETRHEESTTVKNFTAFIAIALRRISLVLAFINTTGLILLSCFHFSHFLDNCYCNASVIGGGTDSYITISFEGWNSTMRTSRILATVLAVASMTIYMTSLWIMNALSRDIGYM